MRVPEILTPEHRSSALAALRQYFASEAGKPTHTGARFEVVGHAWNDPSYANEVTPADLLALSTLSVRTRGTAAIEATAPDFQAAVSTLLSRIPLDASLGSATAFDDYLAPRAPGWELWRLVDGIEGFGPTRVSKLLARKRANLFPIYDTEINAAWELGGDSNMWRPMHAAISSDDGALLGYAEELRIEAGVSPVVAPLRVLDAIVWRWQKNRARSGVGDL